MEEFILQVIINGREIDLNARLLHFGYSYKIEVEVSGSKLHFERDDEGEWRALLTEEDLEKNNTIKMDTVQAIIQCLDQVTK